MLTDARKSLRAKHLTATDMVAVLGLSPWRTAAGVWLEKTGRAEDVEEGADTAATRRGSRLESALLDEAEERLGNLRRNVFRVHKGGVLSATLDAVVVATGAVVEAKTAARPGEEWGEPGTDAVPERVIVQTHVQMICAETQLAHVIALLGGYRGLTIEFYQVDYNARLGETIIQRAEQFWHDHVEADVAPPDSVPTLDELRLVRREPQKVIEFGEDKLTLVVAWQEAVSAASKAEAQKKAAQAAVIAALGDAEAATCGELGTLTYFSQHRDGYTVAPTDYRVLRLKRKE